jgi:hypothetical protein
MADHPTQHPRRTTPARAYRLPDVLVAERAPLGIGLALLGAFVCSLGIFRACQLEQAVRQTDIISPSPR